MVERRPARVKIVVLVKQVPHAVGGDLSFAADLTLDRVGRPAHLNEADEFAVDQALRIALRRRDVQITVVTMGPVRAVDALRRALVLGADEGVHVLDEGLSGCDALATSRVLATVVERLGFDLVLCGTASADSGMSMIPAMVAERLCVAALCFADALKVRENTVEIRRDDGLGLEVFAADLPAVVSVTERCGEPRYPRFVATVEARHKPIRTWSLADLGIDRAEVGLRAAATVVRAATPQAGGRAHVVVEGDATSAAIRLAEFLAERQFL
jgi:electron transfer flavoprotein beta subunit